MTPGSPQERSNERGAEVVGLLSDGKERSLNDIARALFLSRYQAEARLLDLIATGKVKRFPDYRVTGKQGRPQYLYVLAERYDLEALEKERRGKLSVAEMQVG